MTAAQFDLRGLFLAIDAERKQRRLSWVALGREVGVAPSTIRRFGQAHDAEADGVLALVRWLAAAPEEYVTNGSVGRQRLPSVGKGYVRVDMELVAKAEEEGGRGRTRTTIQHLVEVAQRIGEPVVALTRVSEF